VAEGNGSSRIALVTGAARGIGRDIALRLAADGLDMAVNYIGANADQLEGVAEEIRGTGAWRRSSRTIRIRARSRGWFAEWPTSSVAST